MAGEFDDHPDMHAAPPETGLPPAEGWYEDPFGVHESRWISDGQPTSLVRDQGVETDDEPPAEPMPDELTLAASTPPAEAADLRRADEAVQDDQSFAASDAVDAAFYSEGDLSTGAAG